MPRVKLELLVRYYPSHLARTPIKTHKGDGKWPLFVNEQLSWWSASIAESGNLTLNISDHDLVYIIRKKGKVEYRKLSFTGRSYRTYDRELFQEG